MTRHLTPLALGALLLTSGAAEAQQGQYPLMEKIAQKVIQHYQTTPCGTLKQEQSQPKTGEKAQMEQRAIQELRTNPDMRKQFLNRVAAPIANKMFECEMIP
ncbi:MAG TPA: hypothetical protein VIT62_03870 [Lysobacter sp.]